MQILKDEVKQSIRQAALAEFKKHGYLKASIRQIADAAGITPGNIYRYFKSKDDLFDELIQPIHAQLAEVLRVTKQEVDSTLCTVLSDHLVILRQIDASLIQLFKESSAELTILLNLSEGSRYQSTKQDMITLVVQIMTEVFTAELAAESGQLAPQDRLTASMMATTLVESICLILRDHEDGDTIKLLVDELLYVYCTGISEKIKLLKA
ncbi:TetR/AcrR family transcriptional regulator [Paenibacillus roseipurpureus]|uniref:TetR/AcrR family transcriptional regulator n=1 Tax=Paenibacillus roseopurpureus TaxID=2918901 RepID=A0AA96RKN1_9BACL|nr:TetR/AcrR family transcriptional regulator [Paenibacillus sp. MBLB1832]WNR44496.1 TetR/AcrR family transcriptional regulator [Paenibacillus sp. MBLB1832]